MKIYTRNGDAGETSLYGGARRPKDDRRVQAYGEVDEMQAVLGVVESLLRGQPEVPGMATLADLVAPIQKDCYLICCELARTTPAPAAGSLPAITASRTEWVERQIDAIDGTLPPLRRFILQGGLLPGAYLHLARAVCRRSERAVAGLMRQEDVSPEVARYLNRLSDLFFVMARRANQLGGVEERELE